MVDPNVGSSDNSVQAQIVSQIYPKTTVEHLQGRKLFVATPMYAGQCTGLYTRSLFGLTALATRFGIPVHLSTSFNEALIPRARNYLVDEFLRSDATHMIFIDADIGFNPFDVLSMLAQQSSNPVDDPYDIIAGPYPKKVISWEKIKMAIDKGAIGNNPNELTKYMGDFVFNVKPGTDKVYLGKPVEVLEAGTGFMMIRRNTFDAFREKFPEYSYKPDDPRTEHFDGSREIHMYFQAEIDPKSRRYLSEDYWFCQKCQEIDMKIFLCPWMKTCHVGSYVFGGSLLDLIQLGAPVTADLAALRDIRQQEKKAKGA